MSRRTREINRITTAIITISIKLMVLALLILLLYEAVVGDLPLAMRFFMQKRQRRLRGEKSRSR